MKLTMEEDNVRTILIKVAKGKQTTHKRGLISYKELWELMSDETWGRGKIKRILGWITRISGYELDNERPPLNELVVVKGKKEPGERWDSIKAYLENTFNTTINFKSHEEAQKACWHYWRQRVS
jgi:hypothetical protein